MRTAPDTRIVEATEAVEPTAVEDRTESAEPKRANPKVERVFPRQEGPPTLAPSSPTNEPEIEVSEAKFPP